MAYRPSLSNYRLRNWAIAFGVAAFVAGAQAAQISARLPKVPWLLLFLFELPVWSVYVILAPAIFFVSRRFPLLGPRTFVNVLLQLIPAAVIVFTAFYIVESARHYIAEPLVRGFGIANTKEALDYIGPESNIPIHERSLEALSVYSIFFFFVYFAIAIFYDGIRYYRELMQARIRARQLETLLARSQLDSLKLQLQPHFLFNTLNTVSSLMTRDVALARRMLARLSDLLRQSLRDPGRHEASVRNELEFLDAYVEIQRARFGSRLVIAKDIDPGALSVCVPRMMLQPLVENSIRHGMRDGAEALVIEIVAIRDGDVLNVSVRDNGRGTPADEFSEGLGLRNTRDRLEQLYGDSFELSIGNAPGSGFDVDIAVPVRQMEIETTAERQRGIA